METQVVSPVDCRYGVKFKMFTCNQIGFPSLLSLTLTLFFAGNADANASQDPWVGIYKAKPATDSDDGLNKSPIRKLVLSSRGGNNYNAIVEVSSLNSRGKSVIKLKGVATLFFPSNSKVGADRLLVFFPAVKNKSFLEVYPGLKSSPVRNRSYLSLSYTYFESVNLPEYASAEVVREMKGNR